MANRRPRVRVSRLGSLALLFVASLLRGDSPDVAGPHVTASGARQIEALVAIKDSKTPLQQKIDSRLFLGLLHQRGDARLAPLTQYRFVEAEADGRIAVDIPLASADDREAIVAAIEARGGVILSAPPAYPTVRARLRFEDLEPLAALEGVRAIRGGARALTGAVNVSEGDRTHGAEGARAFFGVNGSGVKVGVLSDGVNSLASLQSSGDLPAVTVLSGQAGSGNEGAAMLEIVHDLAPAAALYYATATISPAQFAQNILDLAAAGCDVIIDDVIWTDESPFEDSPIAQAVNTVTAAGVSYFSSAGNEGNVDDATSGTVEGDFAPNGAVASLPGAGVAHNFGDGGQSILCTANSVGTFLTWAEHADFNNGYASTDYDVYDMNGALTVVFDSGTDTQDGVGNNDFPVEFMGPTFADERLVILRKHTGSTTSAPMFNLIAFRGKLAPALATTGATRGHSAAAHAFSVAAVPAAGAFSGGGPTGPYPGLFGPGSTTELFTSDGPRRILLRTDGSEITPGNRTKTGGVVRQKPDITAADGVSCAAPGFLPFFGTSAAAPHAGAIAALLKSAVPSITADGIREALVGSAIDIEAPGVDRDTGAGVVMALPALQRAGATGLLGAEPMEVDAHTAAGTNSNLNGVFEPGEFVEVSPTWKNNQASGQALTGTASNFTGPAGPFYNLADATAGYGTIAASGTNGCHDASADCYRVAVTATRPLAHWDATLTETLSTGLPKLWKLHIGNTFPDVPSTNPFYPFVENLLHNGVTGGCGLGNYCPGNAVTRAQMAVFLLKGEHGASYIPPSCTGIFPDVPCAPASAFAVDWIEQLAAEGITGGCGGGLYCPGNQVTRAQMAIFLLKAEHGSGYTPPACAGIFPDVPCSPTPAFAVEWIEQLFNEGITGGCAGGGYCPANPVLRSQMAVFLVKTFGLALYGP